VSTRSNGRSGPPSPPARPLGSRLTRADPGEEVAQIALARRELMLGVHRFRLRREDLEDCYSQATIELVVAAREGKSFAGRLHVAHAIEQRFLSRIHDRRRALSGRSPIQAALEDAVALDGAETAIEIEDRRSEPERTAILRHELEHLRASALQLSADQRLVLACQVALDMGCEEFCRIHSWTPEKYRKVAQRARARLRELMAAQQPVPSRPEPSDQPPGTTYDRTPPHS
jgi:DNA-directed RNA polymerase specialized sigma24 family protein